MDLTKLIDHLNKMELIQTEADFIEGLPDDVYNKYFLYSDKKEEGIGEDAHRWYTTSISVFDTDLGLLGVRNICSITGDTGAKDCDHTLRFYEMEPVMTPSYKAVKEGGE